MENVENLSIFLYFRHLPLIAMRKYGITQAFEAHKMGLYITEG